MVKVTFEIKSNIYNLKMKSNILKVKKVLLVTRMTYFFAMRVIGNKQFLKFGLIHMLITKVIFLLSRDGMTSVAPPVSFHSNSNRLGSRHYLLSCAFVSQQLDF